MVQYDTTKPQLPLVLEPSGRETGKTLAATPVHTNVNDASAAVCSATRSLLLAIASSQLWAHDTPDPNFLLHTFHAIALPKYSTRMTSAQSTAAGLVSIVGIAPIY